jgi:hypothetical protein
MAMIASGAGLRAGSGALYVGNPLALAGGFVYRHSTESLILAQDERWRRA